MVKPLKLNYAQQQAIKTPLTDAHNQETHYEMTIINRTKLRHIHLTHSYLISKEPRPMYDIFRTPLTIEYVTIHCPNFTTAHHLLDNPTSIEGWAPPLE